MYKSKNKCAKLNRGDILRINIEYRNGILFVRLKGILTKKTVNKLNKKVTFIVSNNGIRNIVFNVSKLSKLDYKGIHSLLYNYELSKRNNGRVFICGINDQIKDIVKNTHLLKYIYEISSELCAMKVLKG